MLSPGKRKRIFHQNSRIGVGSMNVYPTAKNGCHWIRGIYLSFFFFNVPLNCLYFPTGEEG